ncbi:sorbitol dehydrogenase [Paramyrothecium foliicola]|nr:sorbitol dehydrogenase [Paramyrothecium foliicola]
MRLYSVVSTTTLITRLPLSSLIFPAMPKASVILSMPLKRCVTSFVTSGIAAGGFESSSIARGVLANGLPVDLDALGRSGHLLRIGELVFDGLRARHGHENARLGESVAYGEVEAVLEDVGNDDGLGALGLEDGGAQQTDGTGTEDQHRRAGWKLGAVTRLTRTTIDSSPQHILTANLSLLSASRLDILVAPLGRVVYALLQGALRVGEGLGRAAELHAPADVVPRLGAELARLARLADLEGDAVAGGEVGDAGADGDNGAAGLVAEGEGLADEDVAVAVVVEVVQVRAAEAGGLNGDLDLVGRGGGKLTLFLGTCKLMCSPLGINVQWHEFRLVKCEKLTYQAKISLAVQDGRSDSLTGHGVAQGKVSVMKLDRSST